MSCTGAICFCCSAVRGDGELFEYETLALRLHPPNVVVDNEVSCPKLWGCVLSHLNSDEACYECQTSLNGAV